MAQAVAMESANRVLTRRALDMLKSIAVGEYKSPEERQAEAEAEAAKVVEVEEVANSEEKTPEAEAGAVESEAGSSSESE